MHRPSFQVAVAEFVGQHGLEAPVYARLLDLVSEVGELAKEALKSTQYGREPFSPTAEWGSELSDVFFALICLANSTGVDLQRGLLQALDKYGERLMSTGNAGSGCGTGTG